MYCCGAISQSLTFPFLTDRPAFSKLKGIAFGCLKRTRREIIRNFGQKQRVEDIFVNWVHLHLALNHLPVVGVLFVFLLLALGVCRGSEELKRLALQLSAALFAVAMLVRFTGDRAAENLPPDSSAERQQLIQAHEDSADQAVTGMFLLAVFSVVGLFCSRKTRILPAWTILGAMILCFAVMLLMARSANLGGRIAHPEIRPPSSSP